MNNKQLTTAEKQKLKRDEARARIEAARQKLKGPDPVHVTDEEVDREVAAETEAAPQHFVGPNILFTSGDPDALKIEEGDRRYVVGCDMAAPGTTDFSPPSVTFTSVDELKEHIENMPDPDEPPIDVMALDTFGLKSLHVARSVLPVVDHLSQEQFIKFREKFVEALREDQLTPRFTGMHPALGAPFNGGRVTFETWLRSKEGLDASDPRMPVNDGARFACELDNRLRMAFNAGRSL